MYSQTFACDQNWGEHAKFDESAHANHSFTWILIGWICEMAARAEGKDSDFWIYSSNFTFEPRHLLKMYNYTMLQRGSSLTDSSSNTMVQTQLCLTVIVPMALMFPLHRIFVAVQVTSNVTCLPPSFGSPQLISRQWLQYSGTRRVQWFVCQWCLTLLMHLLISKRGKARLQLLNQRGFTSSSNPKASAVQEQELPTTGSSQ